MVDLIPTLRACRTFVISCRAEARGRNISRYEHAGELLETIDAALAAALSKEPAKSERKGGVLAQRAGIMCGEKGFWRFVAEKHAVKIESTEAAATWLRKDCGVDSRADLDHIPDAAEVFRDTEKAYRLWLEGY